MTQSTAKPGQRVDEPAAVSGDDPVMGEKDPQQLREEMAVAGQGVDGKLQQSEGKTQEDVAAVRPDHRENDAGQ